MENAIRKAEALIEALSYIRSFRDKLTVIKLGGSAMEDPDALRATLQDVVFMETVGMKPVLVHGGGKAIDRAMSDSGIVPKKIQGRRYTDERTLNIVVDVLLNEVNQGLVRQIRQLGGRAVGLHSQLQSIFGEKLTLPPQEEGQPPIDLGRVGQVTEVDAPVIHDFCAAGVVPVIPCLATDSENNWLNVNADTVASAVGAHLHAEKLVFLTDTPGILRDRENPDSLMRHLDAQSCDAMIQDGTISTGMIPKVEACLDSLRGSVRKTHIIDGRLRHSLLLEIYTDRGVGTEIVLGFAS